MAAIISNVSKVPPYWFGPIHQPTNCRFTDSTRQPTAPLTASIAWPSAIVARLMEALVPLVLSSLNAGNAVCIIICGLLARTPASLPVHEYGTVAPAPSSLPINSMSEPIVSIWAI